MHSQIPIRHWNLYIFSDIVYSRMSTEEQLHSKILTLFHTLNSEYLQANITVIALELKKKKRLSGLGTLLEVTQLFLLYIQVSWFYSALLSLHSYAQKEWTFIEHLLYGSPVKESACNAGDLGSIPGLGRSPREGKGYPLQYSGLENPMDCIESQRVG